MSKTQQKTQQPENNTTLTTLAKIQYPFAASSADGQTGTAETNLSNRLEAVRSQASSAGELGSCPWTGWES